LSDALDFLKQWHAEWVKQGGWLFDTLNEADKATKENHAGTLDRIASSQEVLGWSMNSANSCTMTELSNISKLVPWLEHCRKMSADKTQAREEKWRTSSATFHDQARRAREEADRMVEHKLRKRMVRMLTKTR